METPKLRLQDFTHEELLRFAKDSMTQTKHLQSELEAVKRENEELLEALEDMVNQHCQPHDTPDEIYDSFALSSNAFAMRVLAKHGKIKIKDEYGRRVIAYINQ